MEVILPFKIKNEQKFSDSALKVGYNEMEILKFIYVMQQSDLDIFPIMHDERINMLLYGWELCEDYKQKLDPNEWELPEEMEIILKLLVPWSMDIWFSKEWDKCKYLLKSALIYCLNRARDLMMRMPDMMQINWDFLLLYNLKPWNVLYLKNLTVTKEKTLENGAQSIEMEESPATDEDIAYLKLEQLPIIVLRLVKLFDQSSIDMVKTLCMRVIAAWNKTHQTELEISGSRRPYIPPEDKRCLLLICHIYLMAVYEADDVKGYVIDNMINNIRFYYQGFQNYTTFHIVDNFEYTPARYIALTNFHLRVQKRDFFDFFIWNKYDTSLVNLFGVVSQAYKSYLLGNLLMELNNMNEDDFASNIPLYKRLINSYVNEREKSEIFLLNELTKLEHQHFAHNVIQTIKNITDYESKICKGNRMSNIGNYENSDDIVAPLADTKTRDKSADIQENDIKDEIIDEDIELEQKRIKESELRLDPVFQNLPNNESMLYYVYDVLAKKDYKGWHFAKIVLLVKLIGHEQNMIETWRYHPGLTTNFMLNLEEKLSNHYVDLAKIFKNHPFLEQEFWLTAFYLNPTSELYEMIKRLGMRNNRKRTEEQQKLVMSIDNVEAKYGLLSSTIDVKELATMSNTDDPITDYDPLFCALHSLKVPDSLIKDMLTAIFLPRNRSFAWALDWVILRNRCKMIMNNTMEKKRFVDLNMAEANERLKFLIIDYEKYKNRPQLDYGTIEQGYENLMTREEFDKDSSEEEEEEEEEDFEDDEDVYESKKRSRGRPPGVSRKKEEEEKVEDDNSQEDDPFLSGKRRTRARTAATLASFLFQTLPRSSRRKRNQKPEEETKAEEEKISAVNDDRSSHSKSPTTTTETPIPSPVTDGCEQKKKEKKTVGVSTKNLKQCLKERPTFLNTTEGFQNLIDIWNVEKSDLQSIDENCVSLTESSASLKIAVQLKALNKEINPMDCDELEFIDETEMIIHNAEYAIKYEQENISQMIQDTYSLVESLRQCEVDNDDEIVENESNIDNFNTDIELPEEASSKPSKETTIVKVSESEHNRMETDQIQELTPTEDNTSESVNSDLSTAAHKDSADVSESNSKRNSVNIDIDMVEKIMQNDDSSDQTASSNLIKEVIERELEESRKKLRETLQDDQETKYSQNENFKSLEQVEGRIIEEVEAGEDNKENDCTEGNEQNKTKNENKIDNEAHTGNKAEEDDENKSEEQSNQQQEIKANKEMVTDKVYNMSVMGKEIVIDELNEATKKRETTESYKGSTEPEENKGLKEVEVENQEQRTDILNKEFKESVTEREVQGINKELKATEESKAQSQNESINDQYTSDAVNTSTESKVQVQTGKEKGSEAVKEKETNSESNERKQNKTDESKTYNTLTMEPESETRGSNNNGENTNNKTDLMKVDEKTVSDDATTQDLEKVDKETSNKDETGKLITNFNEIEHKISENNIKEIETLKQMHDLHMEQTDSTFRDILEEKTTGSKADLVVTNNSIDKQELGNNGHNTGDFKDSLHNSVLQESNTILPFISSEEMYTTDKIIDQTQNNTNENKKPEESKVNNVLPELTDCKTIASENTAIPSSELNKSETIAGNAPNDQKIAEISDLTNDKNYDLSNEIESELTDNNKDSKIFEILEETSLDSVRSAESTDSETRELKNLCLRKNVKVLLYKLRPSDLTQLRQPKVKVQRMSYEKYLLNYRPKRKRFENKLYLDFDDSSNSICTNSSSSEAYRPPTSRKKPLRRPSLRQARSSDSDNDSVNSDDVKLSTIISKNRKRHLSPPSTSQSSASQHVTGPKSARKSGPKSARKKTGPKSSKTKQKNLVVTPRSASGLKLRISNAEQNQEITGPMSKKLRILGHEEVIQLSSTSSDECVWNEVSAIEEEVIIIEENPLFEEEIII